MSEAERKAAPAAESQPTPKAEKLEGRMLALAKSPEERMAAFSLATRYRQQQMIAEFAGEIASVSWGRNMSKEGRAAIARYCAETGTDPVRHWYVLGGRLYDNAELYYDLVASAPGFLYAEDPIYLQDDERLPETEEGAEPAMTRSGRRRLRAAFAAPEDSPAICMIRLHFATPSGKEVVHSGVNWVKPGKWDAPGTDKHGKWKDPVGQEHPALTAATRAYRKAAKKAVPLWFLKHPALKATEEVLVQGREIAQLPPGPAVEPAMQLDPEPEPQS